jgi:transposase
MMLRKRTTYSPEFKRNAVELTLQDGKMVKEVAEDLGIHPTMLSKWRGEYLADSDEAFPGQGNLKESEKELRRLQRENARLREEKEILKKALVFFSKESK